MKKGPKKIPSASEAYDFEGTSWATLYHTSLVARVPEFERLYLFAGSLHSTTQASAGSRNKSERSIGAPV
jgi:hypothetical protein